MEDFLKLGLIGPSHSAHGQAFWGSGGNAPRKKILAHFVTHCESCAQDIKTVLSYFVFFFPLIIVKSLQFRECRQIIKPCKYCLLHVIIFLWRLFSLFCFSQVWEFRANFLQVTFVLVAKTSLKVCESAFFS